MQIMINISHNLYESIIKDYALSELGHHELYKAVQKGTPLPEHGRLIDADKLHPDRLTERGLAVSQGQIAKTPTVLRQRKEQIDADSD